MNAGDRQLDEILQREMNLNTQVRDAKLAAIQAELTGLRSMIGVRPVVDRLEALEGRVP
jgi:hypothetical protein